MEADTVLAKLLGALYTNEIAEALACLELLQAHLEAGEVPYTDSWNRPDIH